tara:strand:- start:5151 stop:7454 length:2304 start_codon:yes stop_codon:yes gene_type:complete
MIANKRQRRELLPTPSEEQQAIIDTVKSGKNIKIIANAGTSKTTTLFLIAQENQTNDEGRLIRTLIVTYGRSLSDDTTSRIKALGLTNQVRCSTIHGLANKLTAEGDAPVKDDDALKEFLERADADLLKQRLTHSGHGFDVICIDEAQDLCDHTFEFLSKITQCMQPQIVIVGDHRQKIFQGAASKYLLQAEEHFKDSSPRGWQEGSLKISYRLTPNLCWFSNWFIDGDSIAGNTTSRNLPIDYYVMDSFPGKDTPECYKAAALVHRLVQEYGIKDTLITVPALRIEGTVHPPWTRVLNELSNRYQYNMHTNHDGPTETNKLRFWTHHASKGMTCKLKITLGYSAYKGRQPERNVMHVANTRANEKLVIVDFRKFEEGAFVHSDTEYIAPLNEKGIREAIGTGRMTAPNGVPPDVSFEFVKKHQMLSVTTCTRNSSFRQFAKYCTHAAPRGHVRDVEFRKEISFGHGSKEIKQQVQHLWGIAVPFAVEFDTNREISAVKDMLKPVRIKHATTCDEYVSQLRQYMADKYKKTLTEAEEEHFRIHWCGRGAEYPKPHPDDFVDFLECSREKLPSLEGFGFITDDNLKKITPQRMERAKDLYEQLQRGEAETPCSALMELACTWHAFSNAQVHNLNQIKHYGWVEADSFALSRDHLTSMLRGAKLSFEVSASCMFEHERITDTAGYCGIHGRIDAVDQDSQMLYEFKVCRELTNEHRLQSEIYAAMWALKRDADASITLVNATTGEEELVTVRLQDARPFLEELGDAMAA